MPTPFRPFTIIEDSQIMDMRANGLSIRKIARELHRSDTHISQRIKYIGNDPRAEWRKLGSWKPFTPAEDARITSMRKDDNAPITKIAAALGRDYRQVSKRIRLLNLPPCRLQADNKRTKNCPRCGILYTATGHPPRNGRCILCERDIHARP